MSYYNLIKLAEEQRQSSAAPAIGMGALGAGLGAGITLANAPDLRSDKRIADRALQLAQDSYGENTIEPEIQRRMQREKDQMLKLRREPPGYLDMSDAQKKDYLEQLNAKEAKTLAETEKKHRDSLNRINTEGMNRAKQSHSDALGEIAEQRRLINKNLISRAAIGTGLGLGAYSAYRAYQRSKNPDQQANTVDSLAAGAGTAALGAGMGHIGGQIRANSLINKAEEALKPLSKEKRELGSLYDQADDLIAQSSKAGTDLRRAELKDRADAIYETIKKRTADLDFREKGLQGDLSTAKNKLKTLPHRNSLIGAGVGLGAFGAYKAYQHFKNRNKNK